MTKKRASTTVYFIFFFIMFLAFCAFAVDGTITYTNRAKLQKKAHLEKIFGKKFAGTK